MAALFACTQGEQVYDDVLMEDSASLKSEARTAPMAGNDGANENAFDGGQRKIIRDGSIRFETADADATKALILKAVNDCKGYVSAENMNEYDGRMQYELTVRVPAAGFDTLLETISRSVRKLDFRNIQIHDVTEEYIDAEARLKTKKELEDRYKALLQRATTVNDILSIEREVGTLRGEIESVEGRLKYLSDRIALSSLNIHYYETKPASGKSFGFGSKFMDALQSGWNNTLWFILGIINIWPLLLSVLVTAYIVRCYRKKKRQGKS